MRDLSIIGADIDAAQARLTALLQERADTLVARRQAIIDGFDQGATIEQLCAAFPELDDNGLRGILWRAGRTERQRRAMRLPIEKRPHYDKLVRQGIPSRMAAQIAESLS